MSQNRVLIITSLFPPGGGPGAKRMTQFVRHLPSLGWHPVVLTHNKFFMGYDEESLQKIPKSVPVHRTRTLEHHVRKRVDFTNDQAPTKNKTNKKHIFNNRLVQLVKETLGAPDTGMLWLPFALWEAIKINRTKPFDVILGTGPPPSVFLITLVVSWFTRKPYVLDFRDAWVANPDATKSSKTRLLLNNFYEKATVHRGRYVIANTEGVHTDFLARYPDEVKNKFVVIPNGFDRDDLTVNPHPELSLDKSKFNIVHTGSLGGIRNPKLFLIAIRDLINKGILDPELIRVHLVGLIKGFNDGTTVNEQLKSLQLEEQVLVKGFVSRDKSFDYMMGADLLLLIIGVIKNDRHLLTYGLSGKVYDYVITGRPILSLAQEGGSTFKLLKKNEVGLVADPLDPHDIKEKITLAYSSWKDGTLVSNYKPSCLDSHDMVNLTRLLSSVLDSATKNTDLSPPQHISERGGELSS